MMFFLQHGYRVIAHDRRGHGRSSQPVFGHDMDTYAADVAELAAAIDLWGAIHIGHSTDGGEVARHVARHRKDHVAKAALVSAVPPIMLRSDRNPGGAPIEALDELRKQLAANRARFHREVPLPFHGFNRPGAKTIRDVVNDWWRQGMVGAINAHCECIKAFSETDLNPNLQAIDVSRSNS
jgi:non-heme chloroperoxidase